jgi:Raf kinase inhibitor-like YbhB/YbcL family protein
MALHISSSAFAHHGEIPIQYTADGGNLAPPLAIDGIPQGAKSLALVVDDPDAPRAKPFTHWVVYDIPPTAREIGEHTAAESLPLGAAEGINDYGGRGYRGPRPPSGRHRYFFKLYALDTLLNAHEPLTKEALEARIDGHVLAHAELVGTYAHAA